MKFSLLNMARAGIAVLVLTLSTSVYASQQDVGAALEKLNSTDIDLKASCGGGGVIPCWLVKEKIVPNSVILSEELWRSSSIFLKDALQVVAIGTIGNELVTISDRIIDNARQISDFFKANTWCSNDDIEFILIEQSFTLYSYVIALESDPNLVPTIESILNQQNERLLTAILESVKVRRKNAVELEEALAFRLDALKHVGLGFVHAHDTGDYNEAYTSFNHSLRAGQEVGAVVGWSVFFLKK